MERDLVPLALHQAPHRSVLVRRILRKPCREPCRERPSIVRRFVLTQPETGAGIDRKTGSSLVRDKVRDEG